MALGLGFLGPLLSAIGAGVQAFRDRFAGSNTAAKIQEKTAQSVQKATDQTGQEIGQAINGDEKALEKLRQEASE